MRYSVRRSERGNWIVWCGDRIQSAYPPGMWPQAIACAVTEARLDWFGIEEVTL